jgi:hypothetical protein
VIASAYGVQGEPGRVGRPYLYVKGLKHASGYRVGILTAVCRRHSVDELKLSVYVGRAGRNDRRKIVAGVASAGVRPIIDGGVGIREKRSPQDLDSNCIVALRRNPISSPGVQFCADASRAADRQNNAKRRLSRKWRVIAETRASWPWTRQGNCVLVLCVPMFADRRRFGLVLSSVSAVLAERRARRREARSI